MKLNIDIKIKQASNDRKMDVYIPVRKLKQFNKPHNGTGNLLGVSMGSKCLIKALLNSGPSEQLLLFKQLLTYSLLFTPDGWSGKWIHFIHLNIQHWIGQRWNTKHLMSHLPLRDTLSTLGWSFLPHWFRLGNIWSHKVSIRIWAILCHCLYIKAARQHLSEGVWSTALRFKYQFGRMFFLSVI